MLPARGRLTGLTTHLGVLGEVRTSSTGKLDVLLNKQQITLLKAKEAEYKLQVGASCIPSTRTCTNAYMSAVVTVQSSRSCLWLHVFGCKVVFRLAAAAPAEAGKCQRVMCDLRCLSALAVCPWHAGLLTAPR
jgi:hypothetical protein